MQTEYGMTLGRAAQMQSWPTPNAQVSQDGESPETWLKRKEAMKAKGYNGNGCGTPLTIAVQLHGQAAPASSSSLGSRQGLWATPRSGKTTDENPETWALRQAKGDVATMPLTAQVKAWATPTSAMTFPIVPRENCASHSKAGHVGNQLGRQAVEQWATPKTPTGGPETAKRKQELGRTASGGGDLASQANGKLNPRWVETLMGLPIGWTMPSCTSPQTIAPMSCDSLAMELCRLPQSEPSEFSLASLDEGQTPIVCQGEGGNDF